MIGLGDSALDEALIARTIRPLFSRALAPGRPVYLANHSLGRPPDRTATEVQSALDAWYREMGEAWDEWLAARERFRALTAELVGAPGADSIVPKTSAVRFSRSAPISASARAGTVASSMRPLSR